MFQAEFQKLHMVLFGKITEVASPLNDVLQGLALLVDFINLTTLFHQLSSEGCQLLLPLFALLPSNHFLRRMLGTDIKCSRAHIMSIQWLGMPLTVHTSVRTSVV